MKIFSRTDKGEQAMVNSEFHSPLLTFDTALVVYLIINLLLTDRLSAVG